MQKCLELIICFLNFESTLFLLPCDNEEIIKIVRKLRECAPGYDEMPARILKDCIDEIIGPMVHILNLSLKEGIFPDELKTANVVPLYKAGEDGKFSNYRPVSLLTAFSKVFEKNFFTFNSEFKKGTE